MLGGPRHVDTAVLGCALAMLKRKLGVLVLRRCECGEQAMKQGACHMQLDAHLRQPSSSNNSARRLAEDRRSVSIFDKNARRKL